MLTTMGDAEKNSMIADLLGFEIYDELFFCVNFRIVMLYVIEEDHFQKYEKESL